jgi:hypothetical protein
MQNTWVQILLLLTPLILVPLALWRDPEIRLPFSGKLLGTIAALLLAISELLSPGLIAGMLAGSWLIYTIYLLSFLTRIWKAGVKQNLFYRSSRAAALLFLVIGGAWALLDRLGLQPLHFDPIIVLLTAVHFHYAGFAISWVAGKAAAIASPSMVRNLLWAVIAGVPLTALGITTSQLGWPPELEMLGAVIMVSGGVATAVCYLRLGATGKAGWSIRLLWLLGGLCLLGGMLLALGYGLRYYLPIRALTIPRMYMLHGSLNSIGFALPILLSWYLYQNFSSPLAQEVKTKPQ